MRKSSLGSKSDWAHLCYGSTIFPRNAVRDSVLEFGPVRAFPWMTPASAARPERSRVCPRQKAIHERPGVKFFNGKSPKPTQILGPASNCPGFCHCFVTYEVQQDCRSVSGQFSSCWLVALVGRRAHFLACWERPCPHWSLSAPFAHRRAAALVFFGRRFPEPVRDGRPTPANRGDREHVSVSHVKRSPGAIWDAAGARPK